MNVDLGIAYVYIDDELTAEIDCYSPIGGAQQLFTKSDLSDGTHTIRIVLSGEKNPLSMGYDVVHDYFQRFWVP